MINVVIWGCGARGLNLARALDGDKCKIVFCDSKHKESSLMVDDAPFDIIYPDELLSYDYDYLFIASKKSQDAILLKLEELNIPKSKIILQNASHEKLGELMNLFTDKGFCYISNLLSRDEMQAVNDKLSSLDAQLKLSNALLTQRVKVNNPVKRIGIIALDAIPNVTETIISNSTSYIVSKILDDIDFEIVKIDFYNPNYDTLATCDALFFAGGGIIKLNSLKFDFPRLIDNITNVADKFDIPVMFVGVGVESLAYDENGFVLMQRALNRSCVKYISVRENLEGIQKYIYNDDIKLSLAADSALFVKEAYSLDTSAADDKCVGIGVVNFVNWKREGYPVSKDKLLAFYKSLVDELEARGYYWKLFCNGVVGDYTFIRDLQSYDDRFSTNSIPRPLSDKEWLDTMSGFSHIIAPRLHTNIVAFALDIPCVALVWNDKIKAFSKSIGHKSFVPKQFDAANIVAALEQTANDVAILDDLKAKALKPINEFCKDFILPPPPVEKKRFFKK